MKSYGMKKNVAPVSRREQVSLERSVSEIGSQTKKAQAKVQKPQAPTRVKGVRY